MELFSKDGDTLHRAGSSDFQPYLSAHKPGSNAGGETCLPVLSRLRRSLYFSSADAERPLELASPVQPETSNSPSPVRRLIVLQYVRGLVLRPSFSAISATSTSTAKPLGGSR